MPHVIIKLARGRSDAQKSKLAEAVTKAVMEFAHVPDAAVSVAIEDIEPDRWTEDVYRPDIEGSWQLLFKKPGYEPSQPGTDQDVT
jgi:4-oxalocrotonate tautomerase